MTMDPSSKSADAARGTQEAAVQTTEVSGATAGGVSLSMPHLRNSLAVVVTNLELLADVVARVKDAAVDFSLRPEQSEELSLHLADAQASIHDARLAAERVRLAVVPQRPRLPKAERSEPSARTGEPALRVLVIDDEPAMGRALRRLLQEYDVHVETNALGAITRLKHGERFDAILCDVSMPTLSGRAMFEELRRLVPHQARRVAFITGGASDPSIERFLAGVGQAFLSKPFDGASLRQFVKRLVG